MLVAHKGHRPEHRTGHRNHQSLPQSYSRNTHWAELCVRYCEGSTALTLACTPNDWQKTQKIIATEALRIYRSEDVTGAELSGALKNVVAIACGIAIGAGLG